jgi:hypothetical protein
VRRGWRGAGRGGECSNLPCTGGDGGGVAGWRDGMFKGFGGSAGDDRCGWRYSSGIGGGVRLFGLTLRGEVVREGECCSGIGGGERLCGLRSEELELVLERNDVLELERERASSGDGMRRTGEDDFAGAV